MKYYLNIAEKCKIMFFVILKSSHGRKAEILFTFFYGFKRFLYINQVFPCMIVPVQ